MSPRKGRTIIDDLLSHLARQLNIGSDPEGPSKNLLDASKEGPTIICNINELHIYLNDGSVIKQTGYAMKVDNSNRSQSAHTVGIQAQGDVKRSTVEVVNAPSSSNEGFDAVVNPLIEAIKQSQASQSQALMLNNYVNLLKTEAAKPKSNRDTGAIKMALTGLKSAVGLVSGLSPAWKLVSGGLTSWFSVDDQADEADETVV